MSRNGHPFDMDALACFFEQLWTHSSDPFWICRPDGDDFTLVMTNAAAVRLDSRQVPGATVRSIIGYGPEADPLIAGYFECMASGHSVTFEQRPVLGGSERLFETLLVPVKDGAGTITHIWGTARDLTRFLVSQNALLDLNEELEAKIRQRTVELEEANRRLYELSATDSLTGLANRRRFDAVMQEELSRSARSGTALSLVMLDLDHFKNFNDRYGHQEGDDCLRRIATILRANARRPSDLAARYGGEEFSLILPDTAQAGALEIAERVRSCVEALAIPHASSPGGIVTVSLGTATLCPAAPADAAAMLRLADAALYRAKSEGRNCVRQTED